MKICWMTIYVNDMKESLKFYTEIMGLKLLKQFTVKPGMEICFLDGQSISFELIYDSENKNIQYGKDISVAFETDSIEKKMLQLNENGINNILGPFKPNPEHTFIFIHDPNGFKIQIAENKVL